MAETVMGFAFDTDGHALLGLRALQSMGGTDVLTGLLTNQLGVTSNQAMGGVGSILSLAKERLSGMDFTALTKLIPGADTYMKTAKEPGCCDWTGW